MRKDNQSQLELALGTISNYAYNAAKDLRDGLPSGDYSDLGFDEQLIIDISKAFISWQGRMNEIKDPYCVWYFDGENWTKVTKDLYQEDAYKEWYRLTNGGKVKANPKSSEYFFLERSNISLAGRHENCDPGDDFSIKYLLSKSFGE